MGSQVRQSSALHRLRAERRRLCVDAHVPEQDGGEGAEDRGHVGRGPELMIEPADQDPRDHRDDDPGA